MKSVFTTRVLLALAATMLMWGSAFAGIRAGLQAYSPGQLAVFRFVVASITLTVYAGVAHFRRLERRDLAGMAITGIIGVTFYNLALNYGETSVSAGAASLLIASVPIWTTLLALFTLREKLTGIGALGVATSFAGVALIASGQGEGIHLSVKALIILAAAVSSAVYMILQKQFLERYSALEFTAYSTWIGTFLMLPFGRGLAHGLSTAPLPSTLAIVYLGIFPGALAYVAWAYVLSHGPAGKTSSLLYLNPVFAIAIAWIWLGEVPGARSLIGGAIALAGVAMVHWRKSATTIARQTPEVCPDASTS